MKKAEPWNNVSVSFSISKEAAKRFKHLALHNDEQLRQLGILSVQVQGEETVKLSISNSRGSIQEVILGQQPSQLSATGTLVSTTGGFGHGNDPREFDTILNQIKAGQLHHNLSGYVASEDQTVFVVPQSTKRSNFRKVKEKGLTKSNNNNDMPSATNTLNSAPNGPVICSTNTPNNQELLPARRDNQSQSNMTDSFGDLGDMHHLDFNDLIGADGSLSKHYNEMVTDIFHMDNTMPGPQHNPTLGLSPTSVNANQVPSQIGGGNMNNANLISSNPSEHNTNEVDELLDHIQSIGNEADQSNGRLNSNLHLSFNQDSNFTNASATAPALQRQMTYPQYSSKGLLHGPNTQAMFTGGVSGKHNVVQINSAAASPLHHNMMGNMGPGSDSAMHIAGNQFAPGPMDKNIEAGFTTDFNQSYTHCNQDMMGMHKQMISRPPSAGMIQTSGTLDTNWKMPTGQHQHVQLNTMQRSPGLASPKPVNMPGSAGYNPALTPTKRSYPGLSAVSQMDVQTAGDGSKVQCMSMASPLLVNLLQTSSSTTMAGSGQIINPQLAGTVGEAPRPKKKKQTRRKKIAKPGGYNSTTPDQNMIPSPGVMPGQMATHMSPQHGGGRMQQTHFNTQYVMQPVNSPGQYFHPAQSPMPQIRGNMPDGQKGGAMFSHYPNGANITPPGLHSMGKASPGHMFGSDQKTSFIETINRSDVGSRIGNSTPMVQQRVPTPGHSPSAHGHITPNHMPSSSVGAGGGMFIGNISGTVHHGPRMQGMNGMQHPQMQNRMQPSPGMLHNMPSIHQNIRVGGPSPGTPNNSTMNQQFQMQPHHKQGFQFQSPTPHSNPSTMYNQQIAPSKPKQPNMMASPSHVPADFMQEAPPNVVFNGSDSLRQAVAQQRQQMPGYQKRGVMPSEQIIMMQSDGNPPSTGTFFPQQGAGNPAHVGMKTHNNALYHNPNAQAQIHTAGPNNFNNSNNMDAHKIIGQDSMMSSTLGHCSTGGASNITDATVTHFPLSSRPKIGLLDSGEISVLLKGTCNTFSAMTRPTHQLPPDAVSQKMPKLSKKSPGSATDGLSSSPGSSHSHTPSPAAMKRCLSTSNPPTPLHFDPMGSPTSMTLHPTGGKNSVSRHKSSCPIGAGHRPSLERQSSGSRSQMSTATLSPITVNGPPILSRPASRTEMGQQYMTPPGTPGSRSHFQNPPFYSQVPGSPSPFATNSLPPGGTHAHTSMGDMVILPSQSKYQAQSNENNSNRFGTPELVQSPWTNTVANHHPSSRQMNSTFGLSDPVESGSQNSAAITSSSLNFHETSNTNQNPSKEGVQSNYLINTLPYHASPQSTEPTSSPCTPISDMVQGTLRSSNSPSFFNNNQTDDLLSGNKPKKQPENSPAPTVPLQS